jgi:hypothetical protein
VDALRVLCGFTLKGKLSAESSGVLAKGTLVKPGGGGTPRQTYCPPAMAAAGITINTNLSSAGLLIDLRIECITQSMLDKGVNSYSAYTKFYGRDAISDLPTRTFFCPAGSVLTGLRMSTSSFIRDMAPVCGNPETGEITLDSKVGSSAGEALPSASICPAVSGKPTYVVGLDGFSGGGVDAVQVLCGRTLKSNSKIEFSSEPVLLAQYLPKGVLSTNHYLQATSVNPFVNFSSLNQIAGDGTANTDVFPFKTSTVGVVDGTHYFYFTMTPSSPNVIIKVTQVTYSSLSYAIGLGTGDKKITGNAANRMFIWPTNASTFASDAILVDGLHPGSGTAYDWELLQDIPTDIRLMLSGGLTPENVAAGIAQVRPWGVDVSSGVEKAPGLKDAVKMRHFITNARDAVLG